MLKCEESRLEGRRIWIFPGSIALLAFATFLPYCEMKETNMKARIRLEVVVIGGPILRL